MNTNRTTVALLVIIMSTSLILTTFVRSLAAEGQEDYTAVPSLPVVYDGAKVRVGLQLPNGNWETRTLSQRVPCLGKISVSVPIFSSTEVALSGSEPEWQEVSVMFEDLGQTLTTSVLVVPKDWPITEMQLNVPITGRSFQIESPESSPIAVIELVGATPARVELPRMTRQIANLLFGMFNGGDSLDLDGALEQAEIPNVRVRWIPVSDEGLAEFVSPDPDMPPGLEEQLSTKEHIRVRVVGAGSLRLVQ